MNLTLLTHSQLKKIREDYHAKQNNICPILGIEQDITHMVVDHQHGRRHLELGENGNGEVRGVINRFANTLLGKAENAYVRTGLEKSGIPLSFILRRLADYLDNPPIQDGLIHPTEVPKEKKLGKRIFNKLAKLYKEHYPNRKELVYPKSGKPTKQIQELLKQFNLE